jgi:hypothetical protein
MHRSAAAARQIAGQATLLRFHPHSAKSSPQSRDPHIAMGIRNHHDSCRSVACPAIGCAAVVEPMPDFA